MYKTDLAGFCIDINLPDGVYNTWGDSGIGKTYLAKKLRQLALLKYPVNSYTYGEENIGLSLSNMLKSNLEVLFIDRLDMYISEELCEEINNSSVKIILMDLKSEDISPNISDYYDIKLTESSIEVFI